MKIMYEHVNERNGKWSPLLADDVYEIIKQVRLRLKSPARLAKKCVPAFCFFLKSSALGVGGNHP
jgi:hypothetical protein